MADSETTEAADDTAAKPAAIDPERYSRAIDRYEKATIKWREKGEKVNKIYLDERASAASPRRFALLWSNVETIKPAIYAKMPVAVVSRRFKDADPIGRQAGEVLERCINTTFDLYDFDSVMQHVRDDRLLPGRGSAWVRYEATTDDDGVQEEQVCIDFVHWRDFGHNVARTWADVYLVWRRVRMSKEAATERFGEDKANTLTYTSAPDPVPENTPTEQDKILEPEAEIYEIWDKRKKLVVWIAKDGDKLLDSGPPPLEFRKFFPCPQPVYATLSNRSLIPQPDYQFYQDQAEEINELTEKIAALQEWLVLKAFIPAGPSADGSAAIVKMIQDMQTKVASKGIFIPVESWAGFTEKGGSKMVDWLPMDMVANTLKACIELRNQLIQDIYQITGISDILRGQTNPNETLGAQELKAQTGNKRIATTQREMASFARDIAELVGEVICQMFQPETISAMSGFDMTQEAPPQLLAQAQAAAAQIQPQMMAPGQPPAPPNPQAIQAMQQAQAQLQKIQQNKAVLALLRDDRTMSYRIDIETDSTIEPDETAEKQRRVEFITALGQFMQQALPVAQAQPAMLPMLKESLLFLVRGFRTGRGLEDTIETSADQMQEMAQKAIANPQPSPEVQKIQAQTELSKEQHAQKMEQSDQQFKQKSIQDAQQHNEKMEFEREKTAREVAARAEDNKARIIEREQEARHRQDDRQMTERHHSESIAVKREGKPAANINFDANKAMESVAPAIAQHLEQSQQLMAQVAQSTAQAAHAMTQAAEAMSADTELVRDPVSQKPIGSRKVRPQRMQ